MMQLGRVIDHLGGNLCLVVPGDCDASAQVRMIWARIWGRALLCFIDDEGGITWHASRLAASPIREFMSDSSAVRPLSPTTDAVSLSLLPLRALSRVPAYMRIQSH